MITTTTICKLDQKRIFFFPYTHTQGRGKYKMSVCRDLQMKYDECVKENLGQDRVHYGYFGKIRVHETKRPKPTELPIKHAPIADEEPAEWNCEDIQAIKVRDNE